MIDIVLVPSYFRPEFLALCLEHLLHADGGQEKHVWVFQDRHSYDTPELLRQLPDVRLIARQYQAAGCFASFRYVEREPHNYRGNPLNFLEAYKEAYNYSEEVRYIYLVEEDVMVGKDFFRWHEAIQEKEKPFISVGWHCIRDSAHVPATEDPHAYVTSYRDFSSIGLCWRRECVAALVPHATPYYYHDMKNYMVTTFPGNRVPAGQWTEQAGLITRLLHQTKDRKVCWAGRSRVAHVGIQGYHRKQGHKFNGPLEHRVKALRDALQSTKKLLSLSKDHYDDVNSLPPYLPWDKDKLFEMQHNPYTGAL